MKVRLGFQASKLNPGTCSCLLKLCANASLVLHLRSFKSDQSRNVCNLGPDNDESYCLSRNARRSPLQSMRLSITMSLCGIIAMARGGHHNGTRRAIPRIGRELLPPLKPDASAESK